MRAHLTLAIVSAVMEARGPAAFSFPTTSL